MKNKILFCGEFARKNNFGGSAAVNFEIVNHLIKKDFEFLIISPLFEGEEVLDLGIPVNFLKTKYFRGKNFGDLVARVSFYKQVLKFLNDKKFSPDLIHIDTHPYLCNKIKPGVPKVLFLHGSEKTGRFNPLNFIRAPYSTLCNLVAIHYERLVLHNQDVRRIFINSAYSKNVVVSQYELPKLFADKIKALKLGFNISRFGKIEISESEAKKIVIDKFKIKNNKINFFLLFVGGIAPHKGQKELIESMALLVKDFPNVGLIIAGKDAGDMNNCQLAVKKYGLENNVWLTGSVKDEDLGIIFKATDIYASAAMEGFGINQVEAMAMGLPLVARDKGAVKELFEDGRHGFLVNNRNDFVKKIAILIKDEALRRNIGEEAKKHARETYSWERLAEIVGDNYLKIIGNQR